ncbi:MAG: hypothetical protein ACREBQ_12215, partial [Nitrososphaerales archaeon]
PVYCDPTVMGAMKTAVDAQRMANVLHPHSLEEGFPVYNSGSGGQQVGNGPANAKPEIQSGDPNGFGISSRSNAVAIFHTHPSGGGYYGLPSTPSNHAGEGPGDTVSAIQANKDIYVISDQGLSKAPANGPRNPKYNKNNSPWIVQGNGVNDWLKKLKKKCSSM